MGSHLPVDHTLETCLRQANISCYLLVQGQVGTQQPQGVISLDNSPAHAAKRRRITRRPKKSWQTSSSVQVSTLARSYAACTMPDLTLTCPGLQTGLCYSPISSNLLSDFQLQPPLPPLPPQQLAQLSQPPLPGQPAQDLAQQQQQQQLALQSQQPQPAVDSAAIAQLKLEMAVKDKENEMLREREQVR